MDNMKKEVDPCDDFFQLSCSNFPRAHPRATDDQDETVLKLLTNQNEIKLRNVMQEQIRGKNNTAEAKLKTFYRSCNQAFQITQNSGKPLISEINSLGGWAGLGNFMESKWNIQEMVKKAHIIYDAPVFFHLVVREDVLGLKGETPLEYYLPGIEFAVSQRILNDFVDEDKLVMAYSNLIFDTLNELWNDGKIMKDRNMINETISDILEVDFNLAQIAVNSSFLFDYKIININDLPSSSNFDLSVMMKTYFNNKLEDKDEVFLKSQNYTTNIVAYISSLPARKANNYIMWTITQRFIQDLGWKYVHIYRQFLNSINSGNEDFEDISDWCLKLSQNYLGEILDSEYILKHFSEDSKNKVETMSSVLKGIIKQQINDYTWLNNIEKSVAHKKIDVIRDKLGYTKGVIDNTPKLDRKYKTLQVQYDNHFSNLKNVLSLQQYLKAETVSENIDYDHRWPINVFTAQYQFSEATAEAFFPAGLLQHPIFDNHNPSYINLGSLGRIIALTTLQSVDYERGLFHYPNFTTSYVNPWWSQESQGRFASGPLKCTKKLYEDKYWDPFMNVNKTFSTVKIAQRHMRELGALKAAHQVFKETRFNDESNLLPGFDTSAHLFFLSYAQTFCFSRSPETAYAIYGKDDNIPEHLMLNLLMRSFAPFSDTFQCSYKSNDICESY